MGAENVRVRNREGNDGESRKERESREVDSEGTVMKKVEEQDDGSGGMLLMVKGDGEQCLRVNGWRCLVGEMRIKHDGGGGVVKDRWPLLSFPDLPPSLKLSSLTGGLSISSQAHSLLWCGWLQAVMMKNMDATGDKKRKERRKEEEGDQCYAQRALRFSSILFL